MTTLVQTRSLGASPLDRIVGDDVLWLPVGVGSGRGVGGGRGRGGGGDEVGGHRGRSFEVGGGAVAGEDLADCFASCFGGAGGWVAREV